MFINTSLKQLILFTFLLITFVSSASELVSQKDLKKTAINEQDISTYFPDKYPIKRWENIKPYEGFYQSPFQVSLFSAQSGEDSARLWSQTKSIFGYGFGVIGLIALLPEDISSWNQEDGLFSKWSDNVKDGPIWDRDNGTLNFIGHPYFGGIYYQTARKSGYRQWDSFIYSALMSTFYWEYGVEGFAETPSIQDLAITPVLGWVYGEWAFTTEMNIRANNDEVLGSALLGSTALFLLDPVDSLSVGLNRFFGKEIIKSGTSYISIKEDVPVDLNGRKENQIQINIALQLGNGKNYINRKQNKRVKDPISTGIVGVSYGVGSFSLDEHWQVTDDTVTEYSLGLYFSKKFSTRLSYSKAKLDQMGSGENIAFENYSIDSQYYFYSEEYLRPYLTAGFGETMWKKDNELKTFQVNIGTGFHYQISNKLAVQFDWRHYYSTNIKTSEDNIASRIIYRFGHGER